MLIFKNLNEQIGTIRNENNVCTVAPLYVQATALYISGSRCSSVIIGIGIIIHVFWGLLLSLRTKIWNKAITPSEFRFHAFMSLKGASTCTLSWKLVFFKALYKKRITRSAFVCACVCVCAHILYVTHFGANKVTGNECISLE